MDKPVSADEVLALLRDVGNGVVIPRLKNPKKTWEWVYAGEVEYIVEGWEVSIFNDCNDWDYVDSVIHPDGRRGDFDDWWWDQPDDRLYAEDMRCYDRMIKAFLP